MEISERIRRDFPIGHVQADQLGPHLDLGGGFAALQVLPLGERGPSIQLARAAQFVAALLQFIIFTGQFTRLLQPLTRQRGYRERLVGGARVARGATPQRREAQFADTVQFHLLARSPAEAAVATSRAATAARN